LVVLVLFGYIIFRCCVVVVVMWSEMNQSQHALSGAARSFGQVAQTVTLIGRFRSRAQQKCFISFGQCYVEPVVRQSTHGNRYWSILEEENSNFLDQLGYYGQATQSSVLKPESKAKPISMVRKSGWACVRAAAVNKSPCAVTDVPQMAGKKSPMLAVSGTNNARKSPTPSRSPRPSDVGLGADGLGQNIPARFVARQSPHLSPQQPSPVRPEAEVGAGLQGRIPAIEINNNELAHRSHPVLSRHSDHSGFEWYHSSSFSSSTTTDDLASPASVDHRSAIQSTGN